MGFEHQSAARVAARHTDLDSHRNDLFGDGVGLQCARPGLRFFTYYFTLVVTPMTFLSGVFFPIKAMPGWLQVIAKALPLSAAINLIRPLVLGRIPLAPIRDFGILLAYLGVSFYLATVLTRRRLSK